MIFFKTRHELKQLRSEIHLLNINVNSFAQTHNGTLGLVDEVTRLMHEHSAEVRKNTSSTFKLSAMKPEYGNDWKDEEAKLNKKEGRIKP